MPLSICSASFLTKVILKEPVSSSFRTYDFAYEAGSSFAVLSGDLFHS